MLQTMWCSKKIRENHIQSLWVQILGGVVFQHTTNFKTPFYYLIRGWDDLKPSREVLTTGPKKCPNILTWSSPHEFQVNTFQHVKKHIFTWHFTFQVFQKSFFYMWYVTCEVFQKHDFKCEGDVSNLNFLLWHQVCGHRSAIDSLARIHFCPAKSYPE